MMLTSVSRGNTEKPAIELEIYEDAKWNTKFHKTKKWMASGISPLTKGEIGVNNFLTYR